MARFVLWSLLAALLVFAAAEAVVGAAGLAQAGGELARAGVARGALSGVQRLGFWLLDAAALTVLVSLLAGRAGKWWLEGIAAGLLAWVYRGPLAVLSTLGVARLPAEALWRNARVALVVLPLAGLVIASLARRMLGEPWD